MLAPLIAILSQVIPGWAIAALSTAFEGWFVTFLGKAVLADAIMLFAKTVYNLIKIYVRKTADPVDDTWLPIASDFVRLCAKILSYDLADWKP